MTRERWLIIGAFAVVYIVWGSTYLANYLAIQSIPPFLMSGSRFVFAGALLYAFSGYLGARRPTGREWFNATLMGVLFLTVGTGGVVWAEQYIDTGMAALIVAFDPLLIMLLMWVLIGTRPAWKSTLGALVSIGGIMLLVGQPRFSDSVMARWGLLAISISLMAWALASIYISRVRLPQSRLRSSAMQMLGGGTVLLLFSGIIGEFGQFSWQAITAESAWCWLYLVGFGSLLAFSCFNYLLTKVSPEKVATSTYVNPVVAVLLGWALNNEVVTQQSLLAGALLLTGVFFINSK